MKHFLKKLGITLAACLALLPLSACGGESEDSNGMKKIRVNEVTHSIFYAPFYLAESLGYFEEENIKLEVTNGGGADKVMAAVLSGDADIGLCGPEAALYVLIGGSNDVPKVFGQLTKRDGSFLVSRKPEPDFKWSDLSGKEVLAGRKGGVPAMTFEYILESQNITGVDLNYDVAFNLMTSAFEGGTADYCTMFDPVAYDFESNGKGYVVASVGEASGEIPYTCFMAKQSWIKKNEKHVEGFLRAIMKAMKYIGETAPETVAPYLVPYFEGTTEAATAASVKRYATIDAWKSDLMMTEASFNRLQDVIENAGELEKRVSMSKLVDNSYANAVYKEVYAK